MPEGFLTKAQAATTLGVSTRQVDNYIQQGKLQKLRIHGRVFLPTGEVQELYTALTRKRTGTLTPKEQLESRVTKLERDIAILKAALGQGSPRPVRNEAELRIMHARTMDALARGAWTSKQMMRVAGDLASTRPEEIESLMQALGADCWLPLVDVANRMVRYCESHPSYPGDGLDIVVRKLTEGSNRFMGLLYAASKLDSLMDRQSAAYAASRLEIPPNAIESHILHYAAT